MSDMLDNLNQRLKEMEENGEMDAWVEEMRLEEEIKESRFDKFEKWLETNSFDKLMERLLEENDEDYKDKCYKKGYQPYANNKLSFVFDYIFSRYEEVTDETLEDGFFSTGMRFFKGYNFVIIQGQGSIYRVYKNRKIILNL